VCVRDTPRYFFTKLGSQAVRDFGEPSFDAATSGSTLTGAANTSDAGHILTSVLIDGSASMNVQNTQYPQCQQIQQEVPTATHTPSATNVINSVGGIGSGSSVCVSCYLSYENDQDSGAVSVGPEYSFTYAGQVYCSVGGLIFSFAGPSGTIRIAVSNYAYLGMSGGRCTYQLSCPSGTYASCGYPTISIDTPCGTNYFVAYYLVYRIGVNASCFPVSIGRLSSTAVPCS
jgi:hypothetical protein